jgi:hypothetical protein
MEENPYRAPASFEQTTAVSRQVFVNYTFYFGLLAAWVASMCWTIQTTMGMQAIGVPRSVCESIFWSIFPWEMLAFPLCVFCAKLCMIFAAVLVNRNKLPWWLVSWKRLPPDYLISVQLGHATPADQK